MGVLLTISSDGVLTCKHITHLFHCFIRWVQAECKKLGDTDNPEVSELLKMAVRCLKERRVLFKYCAEEVIYTFYIAKLPLPQMISHGGYLHSQVANMRHHALFRRFISALTRGGPGGLPRPIEVHAHDPLRYAGEMLGWLHQVFLLLYPYTTRHRPTCNNSFQIMHLNVHSLTCEGPGIRKRAYSCLA